MSKKQKLIIRRNVDAAIADTIKAFGQGITPGQIAYLIRDDIITGVRKAFEGQRAEKIIIPAVLKELGLMLFKAGGGQVKNEQRSKW